LTLGAEDSSIYVYMLESDCEATAEEKRFIIQGWTNTYIPTCLHWWNLEIFHLRISAPGFRTQDSVVTSSWTTSYATEAVSKLDTASVA